MRSLLNQQLIFKDLQTDTVYFEEFTFFCFKALDLIRQLGVTSITYCVSVINPENCMCQSPCILYMRLVHCSKRPERVVHAPFRCSKWQMSLVAHYAIVHSKGRLCIDKLRSTRVPPPRHGCFSIFYQL